MMQSKEGKALQEILNSPEIAKILSREITSKITPKGTEGRELPAPSTPSGTENGGKKLIEYLVETKGTHFP